MKVAYSEENVVESQTWDKEADFGVESDVDEHQFFKWDFWQAW